MPMTVSTGLSKKVGTANYGSVGASCNVTFEADHALLDHDLEAFQQKVKHAFIACRQAINDQLARELNSPASNNDTMATEPAASTNGTSGNGSVASGTTATGANNGHAPATNGNGYRNGQSNGHPASEKQIGYAKQLAKSISGLGLRKLETLSGTMFGKSLASLTSMEGSSLIDTLKSLKDGSIDLSAVLGGNAA